MAAALSVAVCLSAAADTVVGGCALLIACALLLVRMRVLTINLFNNMLPHEPSQMAAPIPNARILLLHRHSMEVL